MGELLEYILFPAICKSGICQNSSKKLEMSYHIVLILKNTIMSDELLQSGASVLRINNILFN